MTIMMMGGFGSGLGGFGGFGLIGMILNLAITVGLIVGLVLLIAWLWRRVNPDGQGGAAPRHSTGTIISPKEILQVRYARGEVTRDQYQQMLTDLS
jgi:putative membrane protein